MDVDEASVVAPQAAHALTTEMTDIDGAASNVSAQAETVQDASNADEEVPGDAADTSTTAAAGTTTTKAGGRGGKAGGRGGRGGGAKAAGRGGAMAAATANGKTAKESGGSGVAGANPTFPLARVSRIVKADRDIETTSKDAIWIIAVATELFIKHLTDSAIAKARLEKKKVVTYKELASAVETQPEFFFLSDVVPQTMPLEKAFGLRQELGEENRARAVGLIIDEESEEEVEEEEEEEGGEAAAGEKEQEQPIEPVGDAVGHTGALVATTKKAAANGKGKGIKASKGPRATNDDDSAVADVSTASTKKKTSTNAARKGRTTVEPAVDEDMVDA